MAWGWNPKATEAQEKLDELVQRLQADGYDVVEGSGATGGYRVRLASPEGNQLNNELYRLQKIASGQPLHSSFEQEP